MSYKNTNVQKEYQRNWYQRKKLDNDWHQKAIEQSRQYKAKRKERLLNMNDNITAEVTVAVVPQNNESWYQHICAEIRLGHKPFKTMPEKESDMWWSIFNSKIVARYNMDTNERGTKDGA